MSNKSILYLSYDGMSDQLGQSQVIPYLKGLANKGFLITLISCEKKEPFEQNNEAIKKDLTAHKIKWEPLFYTKNPPILSTMFDLFKIKNKAKSLFGKTRFDIIHCRSYIAGMAGLSLKRKYKSKFIFDMRGFWVDERVDGNLWNIKNPVYKIIYSFFKRKELEMILNADYIIVLTENAKKIINSWKPANKPELPVEIIRCCVDLDFFGPEKIISEAKRELKQKLKINDEKYILSYLGALGTWYMLNEMLDFFKILVAEKPNAHFLFITPEPKNILLAAALKKNISSDRITIVKANRREVPLFLSLSNASIFFIKPTFSKLASSPTKQGEIMSMGIPIISNSLIGDTEYIIDDSKAGVVVKDFNENEYRTAVVKLNSFNEVNSSAAMAGAKKYFSLTGGIALYEKVYETLLKKN